MQALFKDCYEQYENLDPERLGEKKIATLEYLSAAITENKKDLSKKEMCLKKQVGEQDFIQFYNLTKDGKIKYFADIISEILDELKIKKIKEGKIYNRSQHLKLWKHKILYLEIERRILYVKKRDKKNVKDIKTFDLATYKVFWSGNREEKHCFELRSVNSFNKFQRIMFGAKSYQYAREWCTQLEMLHCQDNVPVIIPPDFEQSQVRAKQNSLTMMEENKNDLNQNNLIQSFTVGSNQYNQQSQFNKNQFQQQLQQQQQTIKVQVQQDLLKNQQQQLQYQQMQGNQLQKSLSSETIHNIQQVSQKANGQQQVNQVNNNQNQTQYQQQQKHNSLIYQTSQMQQQKQNEMQNHQQNVQSMNQQQQFQITQIQYQQQVNNVNKKIIDKSQNIQNVNQNSNISQSEQINQLQLNVQNKQQSLQQYQQGQSKDKQQMQENQQIDKDLIQQQMQQKQFQNSKIQNTLQKDINHNLDSNEQSSKSSQIQNNQQQINISKNQENIEINNSSIQSKNQLKITVIKKIKKQRRLPYIFTQYESIINFKEMQNEIGYKQIEYKSGFRILQNESDLKKFKLQMTCTAIQTVVFQAISNIEIYNLWNEEVQTGEIQSLMKSDNTAVLYQKNKSYGTFYRPRDFVFIRYAYPENGIFYMLDKSIDYEIQSRMNVTRGEIIYAIWCVTKHPDDEKKSCILLDIEMINGGYSNNSQDAQITLQYLQRFQNLENYLIQNSFNTTKNDPKKSLFDMNEEELIEEQQIQENESNLNSSHASSGGQAQENNSSLIESQLQNDNLNQIPYTQQEEEKITSNQSNQIFQMQQQNFPINNNNVENIISELNYQKDHQDQEEHMQQFEELNKELVIFGNNRASIMSAMIEPCKIQKKDILEQQFNMIQQNQHWDICIKGNFQLQPSNNYDKNLLIKSDKDGHYIFKRDWIRDDKRGYMMFINKEIIEAQKKVISFIIKKMGSNIMHGKSVLNISLPIDIFETRSNLERFAYSFTFGPIFLEKGAQQTDPVIQMKYAMTFLLTTSLMFINLQKPFNPILGETFQGFIAGCPVYCEQISHHPPICGYQLYGRGYRFEGYMESFANIGINSIDGMNFGLLKVTYYNTGNIIIMQQPCGGLKNTAYGERGFNLDGKGYGYDLKNMLFCEIQYDPDKKGMLSFGKKQSQDDSFRGGIFKMTDKLKQKLMEKYNNGLLHKFPGLNMKEDVIGPELSKIRGTWDQEMLIDDETFLHLYNGPFAPQLCYEQYPLASDCRFREDIIVWQMNDIKKAQDWKEKLENFQRNDRKLREKLGPKKEKR